MCLFEVWLCAKKMKTNKHIYKKKKKSIFSTDLLKITFDSTVATTPAPTTTAATTSEIGSGTSPDGDEGSGTSESKQANISKHVFKHVFVLRRALSAQIY